MDTSNCYVIFERHLASHEGNRKVSTWHMNGAVAGGGTAKQQGIVEEDFEQHVRGITQK